MRGERFVEPNFVLGQEKSVETERKLKLRKFFEVIKRIAIGGTLLAAMDASDLTARASAQTRFLKIGYGTENQKILDAEFGDNRHWRREVTKSKVTQKMPDGTEVELEPRVEPVELPGPIKAKNGLLTPELLQQILGETYPKNWFAGDVEKISQIDSDKDPDIPGGKKIGWVAASAEDLDDGRDRLTFYKGSKKLSLDDIIYTLSHEGAHANDFERDRNLSFEEFDDLAVKILQRLKSKDRYKSHYVEAIKIKKDRKLENHIKALEYWAEVCAQYFKDASRLHVEDVMLVETVIKKNDTNFDWKKASERRKELMALARK